MRATEHDLNSLRSIIRYAVQLRIALRNGKSIILKRH